jgi:alkylation response protein AidB-like acyl-CoA dehydrogenase
MASSIVDRRDMDFVLYEQLGITTLTTSGKYSHFSKQEFDMVLDQAVKFAQNDLAPTNVDGDRIGAQWKEGKVTLPPSFHGPLQQYAEQGWVASVEEPEVGGQGLPLTLFTAAYEAFVAGNMAMSQYMTLTHGTALLIKLFGTEEQKNLYLEKLLGFEWGGTMCLTEPGAGSDLARIITRAEKIDDRYYRITGQKCFITAGDHDGKPNIIHAVLARLDGDPAGIKGISLFIVPKHLVSHDGSLDKSNDVYCSGIEHKMGIRGAATCSLIFGDSGECIGELLGDRCKGIQAMFYMMNEERLVVAMQAQGLAGTAYLNARDYAKERIQGTDITQKGAAAKPVPIIAHPDIRRSLLWMKAYVEGLRALNYYTAFCIDRRNSTADEQEQKKLYGLIEFLTPVCKAYTSDMGFQVCNAAIQVFGGYGYCQDYPVEQFTRDCRITAIYEGTNGIQAIDLLSRKISMSRGEVLKHLIAEIDKTIEAAADVPTLKKSASAVKMARKQMLDAVSHLTSQIQAGRVHDAFMGATPLMEIVGDMLLGWMHLWQAIIANERLNKLFEEKGARDNEQRRSLVISDTEAAFYSGKIHSAQFFISRVLPVIQGKVIALSNEEFSLADVDETCFR